MKHSETFAPTWDSPEGYENELRRDIPKTSSPWTAKLLSAARCLYDYAMKPAVILPKPNERSFSDDDELSIRVLTHSIDRSRLAGSRGILETPLPLCHDGDLSVGAAVDRTRRVKRGCRANID